jgi:large subunit ribosomal protein L25
MKEPEKPAEAEVEEETAEGKDGKDAAPVIEGDKKESEEKKAPEEKK